MFARVRVRLRRLTLGQVAVVLGVGFGFFPFWFRFFPHYRVAPPLDVRDFSAALWAGGVYGLLLVGLFGFYWLGYKRSWVEGRSLGWLLGVTGVFCVPLLFTYPINANDVFRYFMRGRIFSIYGENPYLLAPTSFPADVFLPLGGEWVGFTSPYGPLWELLASGVGWLAQDSLLVGLLGFKLLAVVCHLGVGVVVWWVCDVGNPAGRTRRTLLWLWNPALLLMFVVDAHNDALMLFWLALGYLVWLKNKPTLGFLILCLAPLSKPIGLLPLPFFFVAFLAGERSWQEKGRFAVLTIVGGLGLLWVTFLPFGSPIYLLERLLAESLGSAGFSPGILLYLIGRELSVNWLAVINQVGTGLLGVFVLGLTWAVWRGRPVVRAGADVFAGYFATALTFRIWYATWPLLWLLFDGGDGVEEDGRLPAGVSFLFTTQLSVVIYNHIGNYVFDGVHFWGHLIGVPFVFGVPLGVWWWVRAKKRKEYLS